MQKQTNTNATKTQAKPATVAKPEAKATVKASAKPVTLSPEKQAERAARRILTGAKRDADTILAQRTHFGVTSGRDDAYLALFAQHADASGTVSVAKLREIGANPFYSGSAKASDAGAINRAIKAGRAKANATGEQFTLTPEALALGRSKLKQLSAPKA